MSIIAEAIKKAQSASRSINQGKLPEARKKTAAKKEPPKKRSPIFYIGFPAAVLFIFLGALLFYFLRESPPIKESSPPERSPESFAVVPAAEPVAVREEELTPAHSPLITHVEIDEAINLSGIMYTPEKPLAVINNSMWGEGERIGKFRIVEIGKNFIKIEAGGQEFTIELKR